MLAKPDRNRIGTGSWSGFRNRTGIPKKTGTGPERFGPAATLLSEPQSEAISINFDMLILRYCCGVRVSKKAAEKNAEEGDDEVYKQLEAGLKKNTDIKGMPHAVSNLKNYTNNRIQ